MKEFDEEKIINEISLICKQDNHENTYGAKYLGGGVFKTKLVDRYVGSNLLEEFRNKGYILCGACTLNGKFGDYFELSLEWTSKEKSD